MLQLKDIPAPLKDHFDQTPDVLCGRLRLRGTRISVDQVLELLQIGAAPADIVRSFPSLTITDISAVERLAAHYTLLALQPA